MNEMQAKNGLLKRMSCFKHQTSEENPLILQQQQQALLLNQRQQQLSPGMQQQFISLNNKMPSSSNINNRANQLSSNANQYQNSEQISSEIYYNNQNINHNPGMRMLPPGYNNNNNNINLYNNPRMVSIGNCSSWNPDHPFLIT